MSIKDKIVKMLMTHPKFITFGIGLVITFAISTVIGMVDNGQALAFQNQENSGSNALNLNDGQNALGQQ